MSFTYLAPEWFFGYDVILELLFAIVTLMVSLFAFRMYKATDQDQIRLFGISFSFISVSYFIQSVFNYLMISKANENICNAFKIRSIVLFDTAGLHTHILFMTAGLILLVYMAFKIDDIRVLWLMVLLTLLGIFLNQDIQYMFFLFSTIYLIYLSWHFIKNYLRNRQSKTLLVAIAFVFLLFGMFHFLFSVDHRLFYVVGHLLELVAYLMLLLNFYLVRKK